MVDVSDASGRPDPVKDFEVIKGELVSFGAHLERKADDHGGVEDRRRQQRQAGEAEAYCKKKKLELFPISAVTGKGIEELKFAMADKVEQMREDKSSVFKRKWSGRLVSQHRTSHMPVARRGVLARRSGELNLRRSAVNLASLCAGL